MKKVLVILGVLVIAASAAIPAFGLDLKTNTTSTSTSAEVQNVKPHIYNDTFVMQIKTVEDILVYEEVEGAKTPDLLRSDANIPYAFAGEGVTLAVTIYDLNGEGDLDNADVFFVLDKDGNLATTGDQITKRAGYDSATFGDNDPYNLTFYLEYTVENSVSGHYKIFVTAADEKGDAADNSPVQVGEIFFNPMVGIDVFANVTESRTTLSGINFGNVKPGDTDVPAQENTIAIVNTDPDGVGIKIIASASATSLTGPGGAIPAENIEAEILKANNETQGYPVTMSNAEEVILFELLKPGVNNELEFNVTLDVPSPLVSGSYSGSMAFYATGI